MPEFGSSSLQKLSTVHPDLQRLFLEVVKHFDCAVIEGHRNEIDQNRAFDEGHSKKRWPDGKHNSIPARAIDVGPYPLNWADKERFYFFAGFVKATAIQMGINIRLGCDWNSNNDFKDETFIDAPHFELI